MAASSETSGGIQSFLIQSILDATGDVLSCKINMQNRHNLVTSQEYGSEYIITPIKYNRRLIKLSPNNAGYFKRIMKIKRIKINLQRDIKRKNIKYTENYLIKLSNLHKGACTSFYLVMLRRSSDYDSAHSVQKND